MFYLGQKVVCVDASPYTGRWDVGEAPVEGRVYTVRGMRQSLNPKAYGGLVLWFFELERSPRVQRLSLASRSNLWAGYRATRFRPVCDKKTDISVFTALLDTTKTPQHA